MRTTESAKHFPWWTLLGVFVWLAADLFSRVFSFFKAKSRLSFLERVAFVPFHPKALGFLSFLWHPHFFALFISLLFFWVFSPRVFERRGAPLTLFLGLSSVLLSLLSFRVLHPQSTAPLLCPEAFLGALLGAFMRREIWGTVSTLVIGLGWIRVLEVPAYVLLFFWFFYLLLGNFFLAEPFSDSPMLYWIPFFSFLWGFALESILGGLCADRNSSVEIAN